MALSRVPCSAGLAGSNQASAKNGTVGVDWAESTRESYIENVLDLLEKVVSRAARQPFSSSEWSENPWAGHSDAAEK